MDGLALFKRYNDYNHWMNQKLYAVCADIPDARRKQDQGAFFRSIHGTLNHILLGDRLWLQRFKGEADNLPSLDAELYADFTELRQQRDDTDAAITAWLNTLTDKDLAVPFTFTSRVKQQQRTFLLKDMLLHFFNHQTHHRGQLTTLLSQMGYDYGVTDIMWLPGLELSKS